VPWTETTAANILDQFRTTYPGAPQRRDEFQVQAHLEGQAVATASRLVSQRVMLPSADGKAVVGVSENQLSVHVLAPYPGWASFLPRVREALSVYRELAKPDGLSLVGVRYIDQVVVPDGADTNLVEYFTCLPPRPESIARAWRRRVDARTRGSELLSTPAIPDVCHPRQVVGARPGRPTALLQARRPCPVVVVLT
jgi:uncharacterized protein (TIGR04255 family)